uniref:(northern house mosquito) hypothetical protein n=1 Tax=Culex pipiens TaxID=7175 RepID=A0A8D8NVE8_CULPI
MNIDLLTPSNKLVDYQNLISSYGYSITNTNVTRPLSRTLIDHVLFNHISNSSIVNYTINFPDSDHNIIISSIQFIPHKTINKQIKYITNYPRLQQLLEMRFSPAYMGNFADPNSFYNYFIETLNKSISDCTTSQIIRKQSKEIYLPVDKR